MQYDGQNTTIFIPWNEWVIKYDVAKPLCPLCGEQIFDKNHESDYVPSRTAVRVVCHIAKEVPYAL